jgi:hypothetical protein
MSNHWHGVVTDVEARLPEFLERFHRLVAKAQNASIGRWENFWSSDKTSAVLLVSDSDVLDKMAYVIANPTVAGLVRSPQEWPGVISRRLGEQIDIEMPDVFFDPEGALPDEVRLQFVRPGIFCALSDAQLAEQLNNAVTTLVRHAREDMQLRGQSFIGRETVLRQPFFAAPNTEAPRRNPNPRIAAKSTPARVKAIQRLLDFVAQYRAAWLRWREGDRTVVFPSGTYALRIHSGVACGPPT